MSRRTRFSRCNTEEFNLGLAVLQAITPPKVPVSHRVIAAACGCSWQNIWLIEQRALHKLKRRFHLNNNQLMQELKESL